MSYVPSNQAKELVQPIVDRLETTPVAFVEALIDLMATPDRKRDESLLRDLLLQIWLLLEFPDPFVQASFPPEHSDARCRDNSISPYDRLIRVMRALIEVQIVHNWLPPRQGKALSASSRTLQIFWGGLTLHIKLLLPIEPCGGSGLFSNGLVLLSNGKTFPCELPLSESQIYNLLMHLGHRFVTEYASSYIWNQELRSLIRRLSPQGKTSSDAKLKNEPAPTGLFVQERSLNRYVDKFAKRLATLLRDGCLRFAEAQPSAVSTLLSSSTELDCLLAQSLSEASSALSIPPQRTDAFISRQLAKALVSPVESSPPALREGVPYPEIPLFEERTDERLSQTAIDIPRNLETSGLSIRKSHIEQILENITLLQERRIQDLSQTVFVPQNLEHRELDGASCHLLGINELAAYRNKRLAIVAPPGGGKTRLQQEIILSSHNSQIYHLWIDLNKFASSGFRSFHRFAAHQLLNALERAHETLISLEENLQTLDLEGKVYWHLDGWDGVSKFDLPQFMLSTSTAMLASEMFKTHGSPLTGTVTIQPFTEQQISEFVQVNLTNQTSNQAKVERRAYQLPGLAQLPGGLEYICRHLDKETIVDVLLGYINSNLERIGEPKFTPDELVFAGSKEIKWQSETLASVFLIVKAIWSRPKSTRTRVSGGTAPSAEASDLFHLDIDEILPYMGTSHAEQNRKLAAERVEQAIRGNFLQINDDGRTFRFTVPEVGLLLTAITILTQYHGRRWLDMALGAFQQDPPDPLRQVMLALGSWHQERLLLRQSAPQTTVGTAVPTQTEARRTISTPVLPLART